MFAFVICKVQIKWKNTEKWRFRNNCKRFVTLVLSQYLINFLKYFCNLILRYRVLIINSGII